MTPDKQSVQEAELGGQESERTGSTSATAHIDALRLRIDELDTMLIGFLQERMRLSAKVQKTRLAHGGPPSVPTREAAVRCRFHSALGEPGEAVADAVLRLCAVSRRAPDLPPQDDPRQGARHEQDSDE
ncbi:chorismate mutase [Streptomyces sp. NBC_01174]|uniref:chorismate mutase n=1 Tax=Streptomyces sp. NBC_01174 TaxID=2903758 RepID=UPI00386B1431